MPRLVGATLVTAAILGGSVLVIDKVQNEFQAIVDELPSAGHKLSRLLSERLHTGGPARCSASRTSRPNCSKPLPAQETRRAPRRAAAGRSGKLPGDELDLGRLAGRDGLPQPGHHGDLPGVLPAAVGRHLQAQAGQADGPSLTKKITVHILDDINSSIQKYMLMLLVTNALLALLMWVALRWIGLENAGAWAIVAGLLHLMPYFGPLLIMVATGVVAFLQFESLQMSLLVMGAALAIATLVGTVSRPG
jgi:hypothetical protein